MNDAELRAYWDARQSQLRGLLEALGTADHEFRADLVSGRFQWLDDSGTPAVTATTRLLCSYALTNRTVLMGWANPHLPDGAAVSAIDGLPERIPDCAPEATWLWAMRAADGAGADFIYRAPNPQSWLFLGLWAVRIARPDDRVTPDPDGPLSYLRSLVALLIDQLDGPQPRPELFVGYGQTLQHQARYASRETPHAGRLDRAGQVIIEIGRELAAGPVGPGRLAGLRARLSSLTD